MLVRVIDAIDALNAADPRMVDDGKGNQV